MLSYIAEDDDCSIVRLNDEIQTIFDEPKSKPVKDNGGSGSAQEEGQPQAQGADSNCLLTVSDLEYIGLATSYLRQTGIQDQLYTIMGQPINLPICNKVKRSIRQVTFWDETTTYRVNELLMTVLNMAFDMSQFPDLVDILHGMHALQTVDALMFNRIQVHKIPLMNYGSSLGYRPTLTGEDIVRQMRDVRIFSILMNIFTEQPMFPTNPLLLQEVMDGLLRMVHHLPEHLRNDMHMSLQIFQPASSSSRPYFPWLSPSQQAQLPSRACNSTMEFRPRRLQLRQRRSPNPNPKPVRVPMDLGSNFLSRGPPQRLLWSQGNPPRIAHA